MKTRVVDLCVAIIPECVGDELENETLFKLILALSQGHLEVNNINALGQKFSFTH